MKKNNIVFLSTFLLIVIFAFINPAIAQTNNKADIVFVRVYEAGWIKATRGVYVFYPDGRREKTEIADELDPIGNAQKIYDALTKVSKMGYEVFTINKFNGAGANQDYYYVEYIFVRSKNP
jgi:hypothetical protein